MVFKSDKFNTGRTIREQPSQYKKTLTFTKFIERADKKLDTDKKYDLVTDFEYYNISCDNCLRSKSIVTPMYIMQTNELLLRMNRGELIAADSSSILVTCPKCDDIQRITDLRNTTSLSIPEHLLPENVNRIGNIGNMHSTRNKSIVDPLPAESKDSYTELLNIPVVTQEGKQKRKELENYIKDYGNKRSQYKDKPFVSDIDAIDTEGLRVVKVEDIKIDS